MAGYNPAQARQTGGKFGYGHLAAGKPQATQPQVISGITITPAMYQAAMKQAAAIIRQQNAQRAMLSKLSPAQRRLYGQTQSVLRSNAAKLSAKNKKAAAAKQRAAKAAAAAKAREPGARAAGAAMARSRPQGPTSAPRASSSGRSASSSAVQARLASYVRRP